MSTIGITGPVFECEVVRRNALAYLNGIWPRPRKDEKIATIKALRNWVEDVYGTTPGLKENKEFVAAWFAHITNPHAASIDCLDEAIHRLDKLLGSGAWYEHHREQLLQIKELCRDARGPLTVVKDEAEAYVA